MTDRWQVRQCSPGDGPYSDAWWYAERERGDWTDFPTWTAALEFAFGGGCTESHSRAGRACTVFDCDCEPIPVTCPACHGSIGHVPRVGITA